MEKCKQRDFIEEMLAEMTGQFPAISEVFVKERDIYLCRSLQAAAQPVPNPMSPTGKRSTDGAIRVWYLVKFCFSKILDILHWFLSFTVAVLCYYSLTLHSNALYY